MSDEDKKGYVLNGNSHKVAMIICLIGIFITLTIMVLSHFDFPPYRNISSIQKLSPPLGINIDVKEEPKDLELEQVNNLNYLVLFIFFAISIGLNIYLILER